MADDACHTAELPDSLPHRTILFFTASSLVSNEVHSAFIHNGVSYVRNSGDYNPKRVQAVL